MDIPKELLVYGGTMTVTETLSDTKSRSYTFSVPPEAQDESVDLSWQTTVDKLLGKVAREDVNWVSKQWRSASEVMDRFDYALHDGDLSNTSSAIRKRLIVLANTEILAKQDSRNHWKFDSVSCLLFADARDDPRLSPT